MGNKLIKAKENIADKLDLPRDIVLNIPKITIIGDSQITIENHKGIKLFQEDLIKVESNIGLISIWGKGFEILFMGGSTITLSGTFYSMECGNEKNKL